MSDWELVRRHATAGEFHSRPIPDHPVPQVWVHEVSAPALVLGSTLGDHVVDVGACRREGVEIVRRRSGGGAVWLAPGEVDWIDVILPTGSPGWSDDIHRPMVWLGRHLAAAFDAAGVVGAQVHDGPMVTTSHSRLVCFDGLGPGELTLDEAKLVGISQRRTRAAARFQCCWYARHDHHDLTDLLVDDVDPTELRRVATIDAVITATIPDHLLHSLGAELGPDG